ncbi:MAG TPA: hypothetical protein VMH83_00535 [Candidatus Acidoferrum sp.]|nr:hypothetical protein [Candidatus Acidoferrum sp.]
MNSRVPQAERFYPSDIDPFMHEPLRSDFAIVAADHGRGEGLVALRAFAPGDVVFAFTGDVVGEITQYTLQLDRGRHLHDPYVMGKALHHCDPNCHVDLARRIFIAIRPIAAGDFVTMDYCQTEDVLYKPFHCRCGAAQCRGYIDGKALGTPGLLDEFVRAAEARLAALEHGSSRYDSLVRIAAISQELGNALSQRLYTAAESGAAPALACAYGCDTCCRIPSSLLQVTTTDFTMTVLDLITLVELRDRVRAVDPVAVIATDGSVPTIPCPQLTDSGACSLYEQRPVTCKIWFSAELALCVRNRQQGYRAGINPLTDASDRLRIAFEQPFADAMAALAPALQFRGHDFLSMFRHVAALTAGDAAAVFAAGIDAGLALADAFERARRPD